MDIVRKPKAVRYKCSCAITSSCNVRFDFDNMMLHAKFISLLSGAQLLLYEGHTFSKSSPTAKTVRYKCSCARTNSCKAKVVISLDGTFVRNLKGSNILLYKGYTFSKNGFIRQGGIRFACSKLLSKKCKAYIHVSKDNIFLKTFTEHNHVPPNFIVKNDVYFEF
ncbi:unnamed protein product [Leptidea sinapis]|uniref:FLYWCH-type domain-containing protein n=1 Tax=Leptidea sinapis TaxID=189913 RepID=A0A5E4PX62_9NEOP|nr:unnamed protein product [Leptidea sinapis]